MRLSVIIPVYNGGPLLGRSLGALERSSRRPDEVIVVDDGSTDGSADLAVRHGAAVVLCPDGPLGPATARNRGARAATGDVLVFLDADVAVHPETLARIEHHLVDHEDLAALFGSYDDDPPETSWVSRYKNLLHHFTHQRSRREATTFWAGCGAMRREVLLACGGFDESYRSPSIEDIELGFRLRAGGYRTWSCPDVQATHLKHWTLYELIHTDIFRRALPWSQFIVRTGHLPDDLNVGRKARFGAAAVWTAVAASLVGWWAPEALLLVPATLVLMGTLDAGLLRLFYRRGGLRFAVGAAMLHSLYYLYSSATFALVSMRDRPRRRRRFGDYPGGAAPLAPLDGTIMHANFLKS